MTVAIIDYGSGNLRSAAKAFERSSVEAGLGRDIMVTNKPDDLKKADHIVLPGVGAFGDCKRGLTALPGMLEALTEEVIKKAKPFLGICVGMQLMASRGEEHGSHAGFDWIAGSVQALQPSDPKLKIPHMGWNELQLSHDGHPVFDGLDHGNHAYFVHSFHLVCENPKDVLATVNYGGSVTAAVGRDNMVGTQFHPEKSQATGLQLITNFLNWRP